jgi:hypothetical protein
MKKLNDLLIERSDKVGKMSKILEAAREANRERTEEEKNEWQRLNKEVEALSEEITVQERQEALDKEAARNKPLEKPEAEVLKRYDLSRAIRAVGHGRALDGVEGEMHEEASRELQKVSEVTGNIYIPSFIVNRAYTPPAQRANEETKTTGLAAGHIPLAVGDPNFVVPTPLYREMGCTVYENLGAGKLDLPFSQGHTAAAIAEQGNSLQSVPTDTKGTLSATRFGGWQDYTTEYLAESALMPQMFADMLAAVDRGIGTSLVLDAVAVAVATGYATSDTKAALTWAIILSLMSGLTSDSFVSEGFVMSKGVFYKLASTVIGTDQRMVNEFLGGNNRGVIAGIKSAGTGFLPVHDTDKYDFIYGDWKQAFVGMWGGAQLLVDPFTQAVGGHTRIHFNRIAAVDSNPYAFTSARNVDIA